MSLLTRFRRRDRQPEAMDEPGLDESEHLHALNGLARINRWTNSAGLVWPPIRRLAQRTGGPLRVLDVATGAGDIPIRLAQLARRAGLPVDIAGCDWSQRAVSFAQQQAAAARVAVPFYRCDALIDPLPGDYDVLVSSFFLHHLDEDEAARLLNRMATAARRLVVVHDLRRSLSGFLLAYVGTRLLSRSQIVHDDGCKSAAAAFTVDEVRALSAAAKLTGATVEPRFPCRLLLTWTRTKLNEPEA